jgi:hypothetical protein
MKMSDNTAGSATNQVADPIFEAIERHREAYADFIERSERYSVFYDMQESLAPECQTGYPKEESDAQQKACDLQCDLFIGMEAMRPQTNDGVKAKWRYVASFGDEWVNESFGLEAHHTIVKMLDEFEMVA